MRNGSHYFKPTGSLSGRRDAKIDTSAKRHYKVTVIVHTTANNPRHAAHIAKGLLQSKAESSQINRMTVEESTITYGRTVHVDLSKERGEEGYMTDASGF